MRGTSTRNCIASSRARTDESSRAFWKTPAAQRDHGQSRPFRRVARRIRGGRRHTLMQRRGEVGHVRARDSPPAELCEHRHWIEHRPLGRRIARHRDLELYAGPVAGQRLELHRRLPLEERVRADAEHRGRRIEQAAHRARERRVERASDLQLRHVRARARHAAERQREVFCMLRREREVAERRRAMAAAIASVAAGQRRVAQLRRALDSRADRRRATRRPTRGRRRRSRCRRTQRRARAP